ncbi:MAG: hypothetical protein JNG88_09940 [Phycisphaerales bacterium]|nr:hypothetical protein [Phycisphaerales bacterium]
MNELDAHVENHAPGEGDPRSDTIVYIGLIGAILTVASALYLAGLHYSGANFEFERKAAGVEFKDTIALATNQRGALHKGYTWADRANNVVTLPIERAMELTVTELNQARQTSGANSGK